MDMRITRWLDRYVGDLCIRAAARLLPPRRPRGALRLEHVVITKYLGLGSLLMATPLLRFLKSLSPAPHITLVTLRQNAAFVRLVPFVDDVVLVDRRTIWRFLASTLAAVRTLRRRAVDVLFDLEFFSRYSALVAFASGAPARVGFTTGDNPRGRLLTHGVEINYPADHISQAFLSQAFCLPLPPSYRAVRPRTDLFSIRERIDPVLLDRVRARLDAAGVGDFVLCNAAGGEAIGAEREWPADRWAQMADRVDHQIGLHVVFSGDPSQRDEVAGIVARSRARRVRSLAGETTLDEFIALIALARAVVTIDSAALHLAGSIGTPTVSLHGPELPSVHAYERPTNRAVHKGFEGAACPCFRFFDNKSVACAYENRCMRAITVGEVVRALEDVLAASEPAVPMVVEAAG